MRPSYLSTLAALAITLLAPAAVSAQGAVDLPEKGDWSISLALFEDDSSRLFGLFHMLSDRLEVGVEADISQGDIDWQVRSQQPPDPPPSEAANFAASIGPVVKWYLDRTRVVSPYLRGKVAYGWGGSHTDLGGQRQAEEDFVSVQGSLAVGAEWHPLRWLGVGGHTGFFFTHSDVDVNDNQGQLRVDETHWNARTFRSGIQLKLYFR